MNSYISSTEHKGSSLLKREVCSKGVVKTNKSTVTNASLEFQLPHFVSMQNPGMEICNENLASILAFHKSQEKTCALPSQEKLSFIHGNQYQ